MSAFELVSLFFAFIGWALIVRKWLGWVYQYFPGEILTTAGYLSHAAMITLLAVWIHERVESHGYGVFDVACLSVGVLWLAYTVGWVLLRSRQGPEIGTDGQP